MFFSSKYSSLLNNSYNHIISSKTHTQPRTSTVLSCSLHWNLISGRRKWHSQFELIVKISCSFLNIFCTLSQALLWVFSHVSHSSIQIWETRTVGHSQRRDYILLWANTHLLNWLLFIIFPALPTTQFLAIKMFDFLFCTTL